jgi:hypothetical protein
VADRQVAPGGHLLGQRPVARRRRRGRDHETLKGRSRIGIGQGPLGVIEQRLGADGKHLRDQVFLGREVPADGSDTDPGAVGDLFDAGVEPGFGEDGIGGLQHARSVPPGIGAKLSVDRDIRDLFRPFR